MIGLRLIALASLVVLAACDRSATPQEGDLQGEVLDGTISDAMIPLDEVKSQAPLAGASNEGGSAAGGTRSPSQADQVDAEQPTPTPAETPVTTEDGQSG